MNPNVKEAVPFGDYKLKITFSNDESKEFDVTPFLEKGVFRELKDKYYFNQVRVAFGAVEWPNEQDFSNDTLYVLGTPISD